MSLVPRQRISQALRASANRGIAVVIAPAGFGKTEAVDDAFAGHATWVAAPESGSVEALAREIVAVAAPHAALALAPLLARAPTADHREHLMAWVAARLRAVGEPIVLDDFHRWCADPDVLTFVRDLIGSTVPATRWVIVSRETPELPVGTWLARDVMTLPITTDDLTFDLDEATAVAAAMHVDIDAVALEQLVLDVGGWPLALRLALGAWERTRTLPTVRIRTRAVLFDFLESQVWAQLSVPERHVLEAVALLRDPIPRVLRAAGFPEARLMLEAVHRRVPLLAKLGDGGYRLHDLFREFVLARDRDDEDAHAAFVRRLAHALERFGSHEDAVALSLHARDWRAAIALLGKRGVDRIESGHRDAILAALKALPADYQNDPVVTGLRGYALALDGNFELARREMRAALHHPLDLALRAALELQCGHMAFNVRDHAAAIASYRAVISEERFENEARQVAAASLAMTCAMAGEREAARDAVDLSLASLESGSVAVRALVRHRLAYTYALLGEYDIAEHYALECVQLGESIGLDGLVARGYGILFNVAGVHYVDAIAMRRYAEACLASAEAAGDRTMQAFAAETLVRIAYHVGDDDLFDAAYAKVRAINQRHSRNDAWMRLFVAMHEAGRGHLDRAIGELRRATRERISDAGRALIHAVLAVLLAPNARDEAEALLARPPLASVDHGFETQRLLMYAQAFHALGQWAIGRGRAARRSRMPHDADLAPADAVIVGVISTICSTSRQTITARQMEQLTEPLMAISFGGYARFLRTVLATAAVHDLTRTELDVLRALRAGGTTAEVAERLGKSSHTVLSHIKAACAKIGCSGRVAAVTYAVERGWIE